MPPHPHEGDRWNLQSLLVLPANASLTILRLLQMDLTLSSLPRLLLRVSTVTLDVILRSFLVACLFVLLIILAPPFHLTLYLLQTLNIFSQSGLPLWLSLSFGGYLGAYWSLFAVIAPPVQNVYIWDEQPPRSRPEVTSVYLYKPLKGPDRGSFHFRLLELLPSPDFWGPIQVRLRQGPFHHCQDYEAISYCWGDSTDTWPIYLDDQVMSIRTNLAQALRRYRFQSGSRFVWADAICIDQSNSSERSYQVAMMREIYQRSQCTLIWLGPGTLNTSRGLEFASTSPPTLPPVRGYRFRDKVFALFGLFPSSEYADILSPNYDVATDLLYGKAARCILAQDRTLDILGVPRMDLSDKLRVPSWAPVWIKTDTDTSVALPLRPELTLSDPPRNFCATGTTKYDMLQINFLSLHTVWVKEHTIFTSALDDWREIARPSPEETYRETVESRYDAFWQTMVAGNFVLQIEGKDAFRSSFRAWEQSLQRMKRLRRLWLLVLGYVEFSRFLSQIPITDILIWPLLPLYRPIFLLLVGLLSRCFDEGLAVEGDNTLFLEGMSITEGRRMARLKEGYIALVPGETQIEDQIFLLKGGSVPVVLRQKGENWEAIGEAYVHGAMRGELWDESRCEPMWLE
ncbi:hypothetical protein IFR05_016982 [Cadophora sp. M221]|nr:hypothetical protein IFR05_016982 [Cadophora sp. M221]